MNTKIAKIILITTIAVAAFVEGLYLFCVPFFLNKKLNSDELSSLVKQKTGICLKYDSAKIKTYPDFSIRLIVKDFSLKDKIDTKIAAAKNIDASVSLPPLAFKKLSVKGFKAEDFYFEFSRHTDKKLYLGDYALNLNIDTKKEINADINGVKIRNANILFDDRVVNKKISTKIPSADFYYKKNKTFGLILHSDILVNNTKKTNIFLNLSTKLPLEKGLKDKKFVCDGYIKNFDLSDYSPYIALFSKKDILSAEGIINSEFKNAKELKVNTVVKNFAITMKNPLDNIVSKSDIRITSILDFASKTLNVKSAEIKADDWQIDIDGTVKNYTSNNPKNIKLDLNVKIPDSNIHSMYWIVPSIDGDPQDVMQKFKKYGAWGKAKGKLQIKGNARLPEVYGNLEAYDVYIVKNNPLVPHCKIFAKFLKDNVKITTRVFAGYGEYVDVDGIAEMKINGRGNFHVSSSKNVDLSTAEYMLVPVHEVVGFDLGPVPYMKIKGKGNIDITTRGSVVDGEVTGRFNFMNTTASLDGLKTVLQKANGALVFDGKDMHFYTNTAFIKDKSLKVDGKADLSGNIDFDVTSKEIDLASLLEILNTSTMLKSRQVLAAPIDKASGDVETAIKIKGIVKDFSKIMENPTLVISGNLKLKNVTGKLKAFPQSINRINGLLDFDNDGWNTDFTGYMGSSKIKIKGFADSERIDIKASGDAIKTDEFIEITSKSEKFKNLSKLPKTNALVFFTGEYKSNTGIQSGKFPLEKLSARGHFAPLKSNHKDEPFGISNGSFILSNGNLVLKDFRAKLYNSAIYADIKADKIFSEKPVFSGHLNMSNFDVSSLNAIKTMEILPSAIKKVLNAYENYTGNANIAIKCKSNSLDGYIDLQNIKFNHSYFKTPVAVESGKILLDGSKLSMKSIIAQVDNTPVFLNFSVWDLDKTMRFSGYFTTKLTEYFANKYINSILKYPIKPKGDITLTADINGNADTFRVRPKIKFAKEADLYYMGANLGNTDDEREVYADLNISKNTYYLKKLDYVRYMTSQNDRSYPLTILTANGIFEQLSGKKNQFFIRNMNIETLNNANVKMFNVIFKKSVLKNGMFNCKLNIKGNLNNPTVRGNVSMHNIDMPLYDTIIKDISVKFKDKIIDLKTNGIIYNSDFTLKASMKNRLQPPFVIDNIDIHSQSLDIDTFIDSLTRIPTPDTATKMTGAAKTSIPLNVSDVQIKKGTMSVKDILIRGLPASNYTSEFKLGKDMVLDIDKLWFDVTTGKMTGSASYNFANGRLKANVSALNVDSNKVASSLFSMKDQIFGQANGTIIISSKGSTEEERIKNVSGYVYFEIADGKMPKLGSVEYLLKAGNFIKSGITGVSISNFIDLIAPIKTGHFDSIKGNFAMKNGVAQNIEVYSKGDNLNIYINGEFDILQQYADLRVYGRLTKKATNILGAVGNLSFNSLLNAIPGFKLDKTDKMSIIHDLNKIPGVELSDQQYRIFTVKIDGHINEEKFVRNFRWIE